MADSMSEQNTELVRRGYEALRNGDVDAVHELFDPSLTWRGWKDSSSDCQNRDEAMAVIKERLQERAVGELAEVIDIDDERVIVVMQRNPESSRTYADEGLPAGHDETANVVTIRAGKVVAMQGYRTTAEAVAATSSSG